MDPTFPLFPVLNLFACLLALLPLFTSLGRSRHVGGIAFALWVAGASLIKGVNLIVWADRSDNVAPAWCEISTRVQIGSLVAIPASTLVITRRLYNVVSMRSLSPPDKRKARSAVIFDLSLTAGLPCIMVAIYYLFQPVRFYIGEGYGCAPALDSSWLPLLLYQSWAIILPTISIVFYSPRIIWTFYTQQKASQELLRALDESRSNHYGRFLALGMLDAVVTLPIGILGWVFSVLAMPHRPFVRSFSAIHHDFSPISYAKEDYIRRPRDMLLVRLNDVVNVVLGAAVFGLFGMTNEARAVYRRAFWGVVRPFGWAEHRMRSSVIAFSASTGTSTTFTIGLSTGSARLPSSPLTGPLSTSSDPDDDEETVQIHKELQGFAPANV
ncbi:pheromone A receptor-domain-containing protein [Amylostereum chailletii]|nr:pheromone A receptor-domain-containing protein [Amylostereum chailletii]